MSKCPVDPRNIKEFFYTANMKLDLPWTPYYSQSGETLTASPDDSLAYWALAATIAFTVLVYSFEGHLDSRQKESYLGKMFPKALEATVAAIDAERKQNGKEAADADAEPPSNKELLPQLKDKFESSQSYGLDKINFGMISSTFDTTESIVYLIMGFFPFVWDMSATIGQRFGWTQQDNEIKISLIFLALTTIMGTITQLPFELYSTFRIEKKHGFNKQTLGLFFSDKLKSLLLTAAIGGPFVALLLTIIKSGGPYFYLYVWAFMFVFSVIMMTIVPVLIMPLFNKYEPLPEGSLKTAIYKLADTLHYPLTKLFVMDGSKRSSHSNAFMFGFGKNKRIVLFDTLMTQVHEDEILAILGHELGHWKLGHTLSNFLITQLYFGAAFYIFSLCYTSADLYRAFGFDSAETNTPTIIALLLFFQTIWSPVDKVLSFVLTMFSRHNEFAADAFSVELGMSQKLQSGLCKIHLENLGAMCPDPWYSMYHYSHPPLVERLSAMMKMDKKNK